MTRVLIVSPSITNKGGISTIVEYIKNDSAIDYKYYFISSHKDGNIIRKFLIFFLCIIKLINFMCFKKIDIVHIHISEKGSVIRKNIIVKICKFFNKKIILHHHGAEFIKSFEKSSNKRKKKIIKMLRKVDLNIVLSQKTLNEYKEKFSITNVDILYNAVNKQNYLYNVDGNIILFLGRLGERKGVYDLLDAIEIINNKIDSKYKFYLCGDGEIDKVKQIVHLKNLGKIVVVNGWVKKDDKQKIFKDTILNVLPSYNEGLPMTILETMSYGIPNIATNIASIPEVVTNNTGFLLEPGDVNTLATILLKCLSDKKLLLSLSQNSYKFINENFEIKKFYDNLHKIYRNVLFEGGQICNQ